MAYTFSVSLLTKKSDCTELINRLLTKKSKLTLVKQNMEWAKGQSALVAAEVEADTAEVTSELENLATRIPTMPEGKKKQQLIAKQRALESRQISLAIRRGDHGVVAQLEQELEYSNALNELETTDELIDLVTTHKESLAA